jgi:hypothetical protein
MPDNALVKKLKLKPGHRAAILGAPEGYLEQLDPLPDGIELATRLTGKFDWVQVFVTNKSELDRQFPRVVRFLKPDSLLWLCFPKGTSKIQTDLTRDKGWDVVLASDLKWVNLVSVDETWSGMAVRPYKPGEARQAPR